MDDELGDRTVPNRIKSNNEKRVKHAMISRHGECSNFGSSDSVPESPRFADLSASFRIFSESLLRTELEMMKSREALRCEA